MSADIGCSCSRRSLHTCYRLGGGQLNPIEQPSLNIQSSFAHWHETLARSFSHSCLATRGPMWPQLRAMSSGSSIRCGRMLQPLSVLQSSRPCALRAGSGRVAKQWSTLCRASNDDTQNERIKTTLADLDALLGIQEEPKASDKVWKAYHACCSQPFGHGHHAMGYLYVPFFLVFVGSVSHLVAPIVSCPSGAPCVQRHACSKVSTIRSAPTRCLRHHVSCRRPLPMRLQQQPAPSARKLCRLLLLWRFRSLPSRRAFRGQSWRGSSLSRWCDVLVAGDAAVAKALQYLLHAR